MARSIRNSSLVLLVVAVCALAQIGPTGGKSASSTNVPKLSSFTQVGFTGSFVTPSVNQTDGTLFLSEPAIVGGDQFASLVISTPAAPYSYIIGFYPSHNTYQYSTMGLCLRDGVNGLLVGMDFLSAGGGVGSLSPPLGRILHATQPATGNGTFDGSTYSIGSSALGGPVFIAIKDDGTTVHFYSCSTQSESTCIEVKNEAANVFDTRTANPFTQVGFYLDNPTSSGLTGSIDVFLFRAATL